MRSSIKHGNDRLRVVRQTSTSPPQFNDTFYMASVLENSPLHTTVTGVRATGNAPISYTMTPDNGFSEGLFSMNSSTGVVTTTGLSSKTSCTQTCCFAVFVVHTLCNMMCGSRKCWCVTGDLQKTNIPVIDFGTLSMLISA